MTQVKPFTVLPAAPGTCPECATELLNERMTEELIVLKAKLIQMRPRE